MDTHTHTHLAHLMSMRPVPSSPILLFLYHRTRSAGSTSLLSCRGVQTKLSNSLVREGGK